MANRWIADGDSYITFPTLGDILDGLSNGDTFVFTHRDIDLQSPTTGYITSQAGSTSSQREYGIYFFQGNVNLLLGGNNNNLGAITSLFPDNEVIGELALTLSSSAYDLSYNGVSIASGTPSIGTNRVSGNLFRIGARSANNTSGSTSGAFYLASGGKIGNVTVVQDDGVTVTTLIDTTMPTNGTNVPNSGTLGDGTLRGATGATNVDWEALEHNASGGSTSSPQSMSASAAGGSNVFSSSGATETNTQTSSGSATNITPGGVMPTTANVIAQGYSTANTSVTASFTSQTHFNAVFFAVGQGATFSLSDNKGNTYTKVGEVALSGGSFSDRVALFTVLGGTGGSSHIVTVTSTDGFPTLLGFEVPGANIVLEGAAISNDTASPYTIDVTTLGTNRLIASFASFGEGSGTSVPTWGNGFSALATIGDNSQFWTGGMATLEQASAATVTSSMTVTNSNTADHGVGIIAFYDDTPSNGGGTDSGQQTTSGTSTITNVGTGAVSNANQTITGSANNVGAGVTGSTTANSQTTNGTSGVLYASSGTTVASVQTDDGVSDDGTPAHDLAVDFVNDGGSTITNTINSSAQDGGTILVLSARGVIGDHSTAICTDDQSNTYTAIDSAKNYTNWTNSGTLVYKSEGFTGASSHTITVSKPSANDEVTMATVAVGGVDTLYDFVWNEDLTSPNTSATITMPGPGVLVSFWAGDDGGGNDSFTAISSGWQILDYTTSLASNHVQVASAYRTITSAGDYSVEWTPNESQGAQMWLIALVDSATLSNTGTTNSTAQTTNGASTVHYGAIGTVSSSNQTIDGTAGLTLVATGSTTATTQAINGASASVANTAGATNNSVQTISGAGATTNVATGTTLVNAQIGNGVSTLEAVATGNTTVATQDSAGTSGPLHTASGAIVNNAQTSAGSSTLAYAATGATLSASQASNGTSQLLIVATGTTTAELQENLGSSQLVLVSSGATTTLVQEITGSATNANIDSSLGATTATTQVTNGAATVGINATGGTTASLTVVDGSSSLSLDASGTTTADSIVTNGNSATTFVTSGSTANLQQVTDGVSGFTFVFSATGTTVASNHTVSGGGLLTLLTGGTTNSIEQVVSGSAASSGVHSATGSTNATKQTSASVVNLLYTSTGGTDSSAQTSSGFDSEGNIYTTYLTINTIKQYVTLVTSEIYLTRV